MPVPLRDALPLTVPSRARVGPHGTRRGGGRGRQGAHLLAEAGEGAQGELRDRSRQEGGSARTGPEEGRADLLGERVAGERTPLNS